MSDAHQVEFLQSKGTNYLCCCYTFGMILSTIGIVCLPCVCLCASKEMSSQNCKIDHQRIHFKYGWINKYDKVVPLDRIQDINVSRNLCERCFGVSSFNIQTAGSGAADGQAEMVLKAPKDPEALRDLIMSKRDALVLGHSSASTSKVAPTITKQPGYTAPMDVSAINELKEIKESLHRLEHIMKK